MALTVMSPWPTSSLASDLVKAMTAALLAHGSDDGLAAQHGADHVDRQHDVPIVARQLPQPGRLARDARVIDKDIDGAGAVAHLFHGRLDVGLGGDIAGHRHAADI